LEENVVTFMSIGIPRSTWCMDICPPQKKKQKKTKTYDITLCWGKMGKSTIFQEIKSKIIKTEPPDV